jgi:purine-binding chemotaxis protein CheW
MTATATTSQIVTFRLGDELFAADIFAVERVLRYTPPTPVPNVPAWIEGVIDYQGRVVPVINLRRRFEMPAAAVPSDARILVLSVEDEWVAATVDGVLDVSALDPTRIAPPPSLFRGLAASYVRGVVRRGERLVVFLDVPRLFSTDERIVLEHPAAEPVRNG